MSIPTAPLTFRCQVCFKVQGHWTTECPILRRDPSRFPDISVKGCFACGKPGHPALGCTDVRQFACNLCGDFHSTQRCAYDTNSCGFIEFWEETANRPFYENQATGAVTWDPPMAQDKVRWYCEPCQVTLHDSQTRCPRCHFWRPRCAPPDTPQSEFATMAGHYLRLPKPPAIPETVAGGSRPLGEKVDEEQRERSRAMNDGESSAPSSVVGTEE